MAPQAATTELLVAGMAQWVRFVRTNGRKSLFCVPGQSHTNHVKFFFKEVAAIILERGKLMLSLLKVCESCIE